MEISDKHTAILQIINDAHLLLGKLRQECEHPNYTGKYNANTGNWCSDDDTYWIDFHCPDCGMTRTAYADVGPDNEKFSYRGHSARIIK
ncbi:hypothetical protein PMW_69 [Pseudomonas phage phiPMW]|uniref:Uncharacterized protein n=1 Tax=Pseudomonas phage phiPMW TaxID=1815582 RepID=A0A1S5R1A8_9CAUD|nr:hypothetical protein FDG97_gp069 [Pseudomonas phage phiPMW]ANA49194.1 hypothetical protein PMW_69 [Pseudomonas phage phiPMW]